jgi:hypothetical protein
LLEGSNNLLAALGILLDGLGNWLTFSLIFEELVIIEAQGWPRKVRKKTRPSRVKLLIKKSDLALYSQLYFVWDRRTPNGIRAYSTDSAGSSDSSQNPSSSQNPTSSRSHPKPIRLTIQRMLACKSNRKIDPLWTISGTFLIQWVLWGHGLRKEYPLLNLQAIPDFLIALKPLLCPFSLNFIKIGIERKKKMERTLRFYQVIYADLLTPRALAYWLTGEGHFHKSQGCVLIYTDSFSPNEVDRLRSILLTKLNIESTRVANNKAKEQYGIRIPKREVPKVQQLVNLICLIPLDAETVLGSIALFC